MLQHCHGLTASWWALSHQLAPGTASCGTNDRTTTAKRMAAHTGP